MINLNNYQTPHQAAKAFYREVLDAAIDGGYGINSVRLITPEEGKILGFGEVWRVLWEGGPDSWGVKASFGDMTVMYVDYNPQLPQNWYLEPFHSFDVGFIHHTIGL